MAVVAGLAGLVEIVRAHQVPVARLGSQQFRVGSDSRDDTVGQQGNPVGELDCGRPVRDHEGGRGLQHVCQRCGHLCLGVNVQRGQRVVEQQDLWPRQDGAGQRYSLPLTAGQCHALLADPGIEPPGQVGYEVCLCRVEGRPDGFLGGVMHAECHVLPDAGREQGRILESAGDPAP